MRKILFNAAGLIGLGLLTVLTTGAGAQDKSALGPAESKLLGIKMWSKFSDVMRIYGQPTRIEIGEVNGTGAAGGTATAGGPGAMRGPGPMMGSGGGGGGSMSGMMANMGARMGQYGGGGGGKMGGMMGAGGPGGLPGMGGMGMGGGKMGGDDAGGGLMGSGGGATGARASESTEGEVTWVYERGGVNNLFLFNKDGRVIQVQSFSFKPNAITGVTRRGVHIGDTTAKIYGSYGWTGDVTKDEQTGAMMLDYSKDYHVAFQLSNEGAKDFRVVGITVAITEKSQIPFFALGGEAPAGGSGSAVRGGRSTTGKSGGMGGGMMGAPGGMGGKMGGMGSGGGRGGRRGE